MTDHPRNTGVHTREFRLLMAAFGVATFGDGVRSIALPLVAAILTGSPLALAAVAAAELIPWLLFSVPMGALVDRWNPRTAMLYAHLGRAGLSGVLVAAVLAERASVLVLCVLAFLLTVVETVADASSQVMMVNVAGDVDLLPANTQMRTIESLLINLAGPLAGGALVAVAPALGFALGAGTFLVAAGLVAALPAWTGELVVQPALGLPEAPALGTQPAALDTVDTASPPRMSLWASIVEGLTTLRRVPGLWLLVSVTGWTSLATGAASAMLTLFALDVLHLGAAAVPTIVAVEAVGFLAGAQFAGRIAAWRSDGVAMALALFLVGGTTLLIGLAPTLAVVFPAYLVGGLGFGLWNVLAGTRRQRLTPPGLLGRVSNASRAVNWGSMPLGALVGGVVGQLLNLQSVWIIAGALILVVGLFARGPLVASGRTTHQPSSV